MREADWKSFVSHCLDVIVGLDAELVDATVETCGGICSVQRALSTVTPEPDRSLHRGSCCATPMPLEGCEEHGRLWFS